MTAQRFSGQTLMIDADDTLWENNSLFEDAIARFIAYLDHKTHTADEVRDHFNRIESVRTKTHGYGVKAFRNSLEACFLELSGKPLTGDHRRAIDGFAHGILSAHFTPFPAVDETLRDLAARHRLILVTKGDHEEQIGKLHRSGLATHFHATEVVPEKHRDAYLELAQAHGCDKACTWMIGNSPRSDINPALAAGLNAVYLPHTSTWVLEQEEISSPASGQKLLQLLSFAHLAHHF